MVLVSRVCIVCCGFYARHERQHRRMVPHHIGNNLPRRLDASWSIMGYIQPLNRTLGAYWSHIATHPICRRCFSFEIVTL